MGTTESRLGWYIVVGSIPAVLAGLFLAQTIDDRLANPTSAAIMLIVTGLILVMAERLLTGIKSLSKLTWRDAITIGVAQMFALIPGISRSGATISAGVGRGLDRSSAARYSFLLGVTAIAGAGLIAAIDLAKSPTIGDQVLELAITFITAAIVGYVCILFLLTWVRRRNLYLFAGYCITFGVLSLLVIWLR